MNLKFFWGIFLFLVLNTSLKSQVSLPYFNYFDNPGDTTGWQHYAISGTDDWELGVPDDFYLDEALSGLWGWKTNLDGDFAQNSNRALETPSFDLSDTTVDYALSFFHQRHQSGTLINQYYVEYSTDNGLNWQLLDHPQAQKKNWQTSTGFQGMFFNTFQHSSIDLSFIQGQNNVKFRFRFVSYSNVGEGWLIDNFGIDQEYTNLYPLPGDTIHVSKFCGDIDINIKAGYYSQYTNTHPNTTRYYFSHDPVYDSSDSLLGTFNQTVLYDNYAWTRTFPLIPNLPYGVYYILYELDALNTLEETYESDNFGYTVLHIDSVFTPPFIEDFENSLEPWLPYLSFSAVLEVWELGEGYLPHIEGAHSGTKAWHTSKSVDVFYWDCQVCNTQYLHGNYFNLANPPNDLYLNIWFKNQSGDPGFSIEYTTDCEFEWIELIDFPVCRNDDWDYINVPLSTLSALPNSYNTKLRITFKDDYDITEGTVIDDLYIGAAQPDLSIEKEKFDRFTSNNVTSDTLRYYLNNCGLVSTPETITAFYWSTDQQLDANDILLGTQQEAPLNDTSGVWNTFLYTKPTLDLGIYYIIYVLDTNQTVDEMREYNNVGFFEIHQENVVTVPYFNDFETQIEGWRHDKSLGTDNWTWAIPDSIDLESAFPRTKSFCTNIDSSVSIINRMHLYTPVFDLTTLENPVLEFDLKLNEDTLCSCNGADLNMSYSIDGGTTWIILDTTNNVFTNWYYFHLFNPTTGLDNITNSITSNLFENYGERTFPSMSRYNGRDNVKTTRFTLDLRFLAGAERIQFRYNLGTYPRYSFPNPPFNGVAILDNFRIREKFVDLTVDYKKSLMISSQAQQVKFFMDILNQGNYTSLPFVSEFYLSADTVLNETDYLLGEVNFQALRPNRKAYINQRFDAPGNLNLFRYLLYNLDATQTNEESNEINNIGYWELALDSISTYPYVNDFNDTIVNGWHQYTIHPATNTPSNHRMRNMMAPSEMLFTGYRRNGEWFTEKLTSGNSTTPYFYLESPAFDFSGLDRIYLSFDLFCTGIGGISDNVDGGNMEYSTDGGNNWAVLTSDLGEAYNWYEISNLSNLNNEPGWSGPPVYNGDPYQFDSTRMNISFLGGEEHVVFRFKYYSSHSYIPNFYIQGLRLDNFKIEAFTSDYAANETTQEINASLTDPLLSVDYTISNLGQSDGSNTTTRFYWSVNNTLDMQDFLALTLSENEISAGTVYTNSATLAHPNPLLQNEMYLFYIVDADNVMSETSELNNTGVFRVIYPSYPNYRTTSFPDSINAQSQNSTFPLSYSIVNNGIADGVESETQIYWSADSTLDENDLQIQTLNTAVIQSGDTLEQNVDILYPLPLNSTEYYVFVKLDHQDDLLEFDEQDNLSFCKVVFDTLGTQISIISNGGINVYAQSNGIMIQVLKRLSDANFSLQLINAGGQCVLNKKVSLNEGLNSVELPMDLARGIYLVKLSNTNETLVKKFPLLQD